MIRKARHLSSALVLTWAILFTSCSGGTDAANSAVSEAPSPVPEQVTSMPADSGSETGLRRFAIIADESKASYIVDEEFFGGALAKYGIPTGSVVTVGSTNSVQGQLELDLNDLSSALGANEFNVDLSTLASDQSLRDQWLRKNGPNFNQYPTASFSATSIESGPSSYVDGEEVNFKLNGNMTIRDITNPISFDVTATLAGDTLAGTASARLLMTDFAIDPPNFANTLTAADEFEIRVEFTAKEE